MPGNAGDTDYSVVEAIRVDRALAPVTVAENGRDRGISRESKIRERAIVPNPGWGEFSSRTGTVIVVRCGACDGVSRAAIVLRVAKLDDVEVVLETSST